MSDKSEYDLVVIGGGTGANGVARAAAQAGQSVASIEALPYGGTCALRGCDPKKMLIAVTEAFDWSQRMKPNGFVTEGVSLDWTAMQVFKRSFTDTVSGRVEDGLQGAGVDTIHGTASFVAPQIIRVNARELRAKQVHVATGARPVTLGVPGEEHVVSSTEFLDLATLPKRMVFIGGGFISFEFAHIAKRAGVDEVTIAHRGARPLKSFDADLVGLLVDRTRELGIDVRLNAPVSGVEAREGAFAVDLGDEKIACDLVVHGAGRVPNLEALDLQRGEVEFGPGGIAVSEFMRSVSNPAVFAAGDCADTGAPNLTPVSSYEARIAMKNILAGEDARRLDYPPIPSVVFTLPTLGRVGLLEEEAKAKGIEFDVHFDQTSRWYSSVRVAETMTAYKTLVEKGTGKIIGAHLMGPGTEEQLNLFTLAMKAGLTNNQIKATIFAYPSYASDLGYMV